jgi:uncharacterized protein (UPF0335 family)
MSTKPALKAVEQPLVVRYLGKISSAAQEAADARMEVAGIYKEAEDDGLDRWALKQTASFRKMDIHKAHGRLKALAEYLADAGVLAEKPDLVFAQADLEDVAPAA